MLNVRLDMFAFVKNICEYRILPSFREIKDEEADVTAGKKLL